MKGAIEATRLTKPYVTLAEKKGCRIITSALFHGTEVASDRVGADTYAAFNRAVREAVHRINANKATYMHYLIDYHKAKVPENGTLKVEDLRPSRLVVCDPAPYRPTRCRPTSGSRVGARWIQVTQRSTWSTWRWMCAPTRRSSAALSRFFRSLAVS
jgi:hypothetical protein